LLDAAGAPIFALLGPRGGPSPNPAHNREMDPHHHEHHHEESNLKVGLIGFGIGVVWIGIVATIGFFLANNAH
jgi:hypothetical protein